MTDKTKFRILTFLRYLGDAFYYPFLAKYLKSVGLLEDRIGVILSITPIIAILVNPLYTKLCSDLKKTKKVLSIVIIVEGLLVCLLPFFSNFYVLLIMVGLIAVFGSAHFNLLEGLTSAYAKRNNIDYSSIRMFGTAAYILGPTVSGFLIGKTSYLVSFILAGLFDMSTCIFYLTIKDFDDENSENSDTVSIKDIFSNKEFLLFFVFFSLFKGNFIASDDFFSLFMESKGATDSFYGYAYSLQVAFELIFYLLYTSIPKLKKISYKTYHIILCALLLTRSMVYVLPFDSYWIAAGFFLLRGVAYGIFSLSSFAYISTIVKENEVITSVMLISLGGSIVTFIFDNLYGQVIEKFGYQIFYLIVSGVFLICLLIAIFKNRKKSVK